MPGYSTAGLLCFQLSIAGGDEGEDTAGGWTVPQISASLDGWGDRTDFVVLEALTELYEHNLVEPITKQTDSPLGSYVMYELTEGGRTRAQELQAALAVGTVMIERPAAESTVTAELTTDHYASEKDPETCIERAVAECFGAIEATVDVDQPETAKRYCRLLAEKARREAEHGADLMAASTATRQYQLAEQHDALAQEAEAALIRGRAACSLEACELAREQLEQALGVFQSLGDREGVAQAHTELALVDWQRGERALAREQHEQAVSTCQQLNDTHREATVHDRLGSLAYEAGAFEAATGYLEQALSAYRATEDHHAAGETLGRLGAASWRQGNLEAARSRYSEALSSFRTIDDLPGVAKIHNNLGSLARERGDLEMARTQFAHALETFRTVGEFSQAAIARFNLGKTLERQDEDERATKRLRTALATFESNEDTHRVGGVHENLGHIARKRRQYEKARDHYETALEAFETAEDRRRILRTTLQLGTVALASGAHERADERLQTVLQDADPEREYRIIAVARTRLAQIDARRGEYSRARKRAADALFEVPDGTPAAAVIRTVLGRITRKQGDIERARELLSSAVETGVGDADPLVRSVRCPRIERGALERVCEAVTDAKAALEASLEHAGENEDPHRTAIIQYQLGVLAHTRGNGNEASERLGAALECYQDVGDRYGIATVRRRQGLLAHDRNEQETARDHWREALDTFEDTRAFSATRDTAKEVSTGDATNDSEQAQEWPTSTRSVIE